jgi:hypothetical protein
MKKLLHGTFFFEDWQAPDPDDERLHDAMHKARYGLEHLTQQEAYRILAAAGAYCHFAGHPASNKSILSQLGKLRAAVRQNRKAPNK